jgi:hypothetical protein
MNLILFKYVFKKTIDVIFPLIIAKLVSFFHFEVYLLTYPFKRVGLIFDFWMNPIEIFCSFFYQADHASLSLDWLIIYLFFLDILSFL